MTAGTVHNTQIQTQTHKYKNTYELYIDMCDRQIHYGLQALCVEKHALVSLQWWWLASKWPNTLMTSPAHNIAIFSIHRFRVMDFLLKKMGRRAIRTKLWFHFQWFPLLGALQCGGGSGVGFKLHDGLAQGAQMMAKWEYISINSFTIWIELTGVISIGFTLV